MNLERKLKDLQVALKQASWFSTEEHVDYDVDLSVGVLFINGAITFFNDTVLEFTESVTPDRRRYRYQYMRTDGALIFRYDNVPHHRQLATFPHHKHDGDTVIESEAVELRQVIEEVIDRLVTA
jgi:hypothetical protein